MATNENAIKISPNVKVKMKKTRRWETPIVGYLFIAPWLIGFLVLTLWPMIQSIYFFFTKYSLLQAPKWVGWDNYVNMLTNDDLFYQSLMVTSWVVFLSVPLKLIFALAVAMLLNKKIKGLSKMKFFQYIKYAFSIGLAHPMHTLMIATGTFGLAYVSLKFSGLIVVWSGSFFASWISFGTHQVFKKMPRELM